MGLSLTGCLGPLDVMGNESVATQTSALEKKAAIEDDRIEDKHPVRDDQLTVQETQTDDHGNRCDVTLNKSTQVTRLSIPEPTGAAKTLSDTLFPNHGAAFAALASVDNAHPIPSMEAINGAMKPFNDGLYASLELAMQNGVAGGFSGKRKLMQDLMSAALALRAQAGTNGKAILTEAAVFLGAGLTLSGGSGVPSAPKRGWPAGKTTKMFCAIRGSSSWPARRAPSRSTGRSSA